MRITNQMLARTAEKAGIPLQQNTLLDIMEDKKSSNSLFSVVNSSNKSNAYLQKVSSTDTKELKTAADSLSSYAAIFYEESENSLFGKAEKTGDTTEIVESAKAMVAAYNKTLEQLKKSDSVLHNFYLQELQSYTAEQTDELQAVGIEHKKDGTLTIDHTILNNAGIDSLKAAFGRNSGFIEKVGYVGSRVAENAANIDMELLSSYSSNGTEVFQSFSESMYDFWG